MYQSGIFNTIIICIDQYDNKEPVGRVYNPIYDGGIMFRSTIDLLLKIESILTDTKFPQSYSCRRLFRPVEEQSVSDKTQNELKDGKLATFSLRVLFRQNASWQGALHWHEGGQEESFRSVLELLLLIDSAMSGKEQ